MRLRLSCYHAPQPRLTFAVRPAQLTSAGSILIRVKVRVRVRVKVRADDIKPDCLEVWIRTSP